MVTRIYGGAFEPPKEKVSFSEEDFREIERRCGVRFNEAQREMIDDAVHQYISLQYGAWQMPRPAQIKKVFGSIEMTRTKFIAALAPLISGSMASNLEFHLQTALNSSTQSADTNIRVCLGSILDQLDLLGKVITKAHTDLPSDRGGRSDAKDWFGHLVFGLAEVYAIAGGKLDVTWDERTASYVAGERFLDLVALVQAKLPENYRHDGTGLGKAIQEALVQERSAVDLPTRWSSSPALRDALMASPSAKRARRKPRKTEQRLPPST